MTDTETLLTALKDAKATAFDEYMNDPDDENHLRYQSLHELVTVFEAMVANTEITASFANRLLIPAALLETWMQAIARNRLDPDDSSYIEAEEAIKAAALQTLTPDELAEAESRTWTSRLYGLELDADDSAIPFLQTPSEDNLSELNDWLKNVAKAAAFEARQQDTPSLTAKRRS